MKSFKGPANNTSKINGQEIPPTTSFRWSVARNLLVQERDRAGRSADSWTSLFEVLKARAPE